MEPRTQFDIASLDYRSLSPAQRTAVVEAVMREARVARAREIAAVARGAWTGLARVVAPGWNGVRLLGRTAAAVAVTLWRRHQEHRWRRLAAAQLYAMDDRALRDIGLRRGEIEFAVSGEIDPTRRPRAASRPRSAEVRKTPSPSLQPAQREETLILVRNGCAG